ncbi:MAG: 7-cyano-7-deazaguanine synthase QueC [Planctomycetota bacterium]|jgi:7-cyano-7-deazaguanine synthase
MKTILIYSGGLDSTVLLYKLRAGGDELRCLGIDYGQQHRCELQAAGDICRLLDVEYRIADLSAIKPFLAGSALTGDVPIPEGKYDAEGMKLTVVPNRNMIMLSVAIGWAVSLKYDAVAYAAHAGDHPIYPDCRGEFVEAMERAAGLCDWHKVAISRPFMEMTKAEIVRLGAELAVPFDKTWSCYKGGLVHCGKCSTCIERREAFKKGGVPDPTVYED